MTTTTRHDFDFGYYGLEARGDQHVWLFDGEGSLVGAYPSIKQAALVASRYGRRDPRVTIEIRQRVQAHRIDPDCRLEEIAADLVERAIDLGDLYRKVAIQAASGDGLNTAMADAANVRDAWNPQRLAEAATGIDR